VGCITCCHLYKALIYGGTGFFPSTIQNGPPFLPGASVVCSFEEITASCSCFPSSAYGTTHHQESYPMSWGRGPCDESLMNPAPAALRYTRVAFFSWALRSLPHIRARFLLPARPAIIVLGVTICSFSRPPSMLPMTLSFQNRPPLTVQGNSPFLTLFKT